MDRERLKDVKQTDLTEGRINQDFVDWLKTKGTSWLLVVVIALFAYAAFVRWNSHKHNYKTEAWTELANATLPSSYEDIAEKYADVGSVSHLARLRAAGRLLVAVQTDKTLAAANETATPLTEELRNEYLDRAERQFSRLIKDDDGSNGMALIASAALNGMAGVAESRGKLDEARTYFTRAAERVREHYPTLATLATERAASVDRLSNAVALISRADLTTMQQNQPDPEALDPVWSEPWLNDLLVPQE